MTTTNETGYAPTVWAALQALKAARAERDAGLAMATCDRFTREHGRVIEQQRPCGSWELFWTER